MSTLTPPVDLRSNLTQAALSVVGFELGERFLGSYIGRIGKSLFIISITKVLGTALIVFLVLIAFQTPLVLALILAGVAPATAPATTADIIDEVSARGELTGTTRDLFTPSRVYTSPFSSCSFYSTAIMWTWQACPLLGY